MLTELGQERKDHLACKFWDACGFSQGIQLGEHGIFGVFGTNSHRVAVFEAVDEGFDIAG